MQVSLESFVVKIIQIDIPECLLSLKINCHSKTTVSLSDRCSVDPGNDAVSE